MTREFCEPKEAPSVNVIDMFHAIEEHQVSFLAFCDWLEEIRAAAVSYSGNKNNPGKTVSTVSGL